MGVGSGRPAGRPSFGWVGLFCGGVIGVGPVFSGLCGSGILGVAVVWVVDKKVVVDSSISVVYKLRVRMRLRARSGLFYSYPAGCRSTPTGTGVYPIYLGRPKTGPRPAGGGTLRGTLVVTLVLGYRVSRSMVCFVEGRCSCPSLSSNCREASIPVKVGNRLGKVEVERVRTRRSPNRCGPSENVIGFGHSKVPLIRVIARPSVGSPRRTEGFLGRLVHILRCDKKTHNRKAVETSMGVSVGNKGEMRVGGIGSVGKTCGTLGFRLMERGGLVGEKIRIGRRAHTCLRSRVVAIKVEVGRSTSSCEFVASPSLPPVRVSSRAVREVLRAVPRTPRGGMGEFIRSCNVSRRSTGILASRLSLTVTCRRIMGRVRPMFTSG